MNESYIPIEYLLKFSDDKFTHLSFIPVIQEAAISQVFASAFTKKKRSMYISDYMQTTFLPLGRSLKKLADDQCYSISKGSIYQIKHTCKSIQLFTMWLDWREIARLVEVSIMIDICTYCVFTLNGRYDLHTHDENRLESDANVLSAYNDWLTLCNS